MEPGKPDYTEYNARRKKERQSILAADDEHRREVANRALHVLLRELNITLWSLDKQVQFHMKPLVMDMLALGRHLNWAFCMRRCNMAKSILYKCLARDGSLTFQSMVRLLHGMGLRFRIEPDPALEMVINPEYLHKTSNAKPKGPHPRWRTKKVVEGAIAPLQEAPSEESPPQEAP